MRTGRTIIVLLDYRDCILSSHKICKQQQQWEWNSKTKEYNCYHILPYLTRQRPDLLRTWNRLDLDNPNVSPQPNSLSETALEKSSLKYDDPLSTMKIPSLPVALPLPLSNRRPILPMTVKDRSSSSTEKYCLITKACHQHHRPSPTNRLTNKTNSHSQSPKPTKSYPKLLVTASLARSEHVSTVPHANSV